MGGSKGKEKSGTKGFGLNTSKNRKAKDAQRAKKTARAAIITAAAVAVLFVGALFLNSSYIRQHFACVKIAGVKYTVTDFNYTYESLYSQYYNSLSGSSSDLTSGMLPEQGKSLRSQIYDEETGETWADFFSTMTVEQLKEDNKILVAALDAGYELTDEDKATVEDSIESIRSTAYTYGYQDINAYLKAVYGKGMDESAFRKALERAQLITSYTNYINDSFTYTPEEIESYYVENKGLLDTFTYRYFHISAGSFSKSDYDTDEAYEAAKEAAIDDTEVRAIAYADGITDEASFY
jgi:hypothetical protein